MPLCLRWRGLRLVLDLLVVAEQFGTFCDCRSSSGIRIFAFLTILHHVEGNRWGRGGYGQDAGKYVSP